MNRIVEVFASRRAARKGALLPYLTAGYPDVATSLALIRAADRAGAAVVEVGFPYSDSVADGPVIQESFHAVLERGFRVSDALALAAEARPAVRCALVAMLSYTLVHRVGVAAFLKDAKAAGFDGIIVPDVPVEESEALRSAAHAAELCYIGLVAPTTSSARRREIAEGSTGFLYQIATAGTTGERAELPRDLGRDVAALRVHTQLPICVGFGVSTAEHVRAVCRVADGAIVGSAIVRRIRDALRAGKPLDRIVNGVGAYLTELAVGVESPAQPL